MSPTPGVENRSWRSRIELDPGQLPALAGLGPLGDLDLQVIRVHQVLAGDAEPTRRHLLDGAATQVAVGVGHVAVRVLAALPGVGLAAQPVHGDGERLVRLLRDRPVGHSAGGEPLHDLRHRLDLVDRAGGPEPRRGAAASGRVGWPVRRLVVDELRVLLEDVVALRPRGVLELEHRARVEEVDLAFPPPLVLPPDGELPMRLLGRAVGVGQGEGALPPGRALSGRPRRSGWSCP